MYLLKKYNSKLWYYGYCVQETCGYSKFKTDDTRNLRLKLLQNPILMMLMYYRKTTIVILTVMTVETSPVYGKDGPIYFWTVIEKIARYYEWMYVCTQVVSQVKKKQKARVCVGIKVLISWFQGPRSYRDGNLNRFFPM